VRRAGVLIISLLVTALSTSPLLAQTGKVESIGPPDERGISEALKRVLDSRGYRVVLEDGSVACEIWLRQSVPTQAAKDIPAVIYPELAESTLVGVIVFQQATSDYKGDAIQPGVFTLRYALLPDDGNHMGVAPNRDFLLLIPAASDPDPDATFKESELVGLSSHSTGTRHPGPLSLVQNDTGAEPAVSKDDEDHWIFSAGIKLASGKNLPIALIVKGTAGQ
jgi:hypothetical protein